MPETMTIAANLYRDLGALAFLIVVGALSFAYLVLRLVKAQENISATLDRVNERQSTHDQRSLDMHLTCIEHGKQIGELRTEVVGFKTEMKGELGGLSKEVAVLKERVG